MHIYEELELRAITLKANKDNWVRKQPQHPSEICAVWGVIEKVEKLALSNRAHAWLNKWVANNNDKLPGIKEKDIRFCTYIERYNDTYAHSVEDVIKVLQLAATDAKKIARVRK